MAKIINLTQLGSVGNYQSSLKKIVFYSGVFDLFHYGHFLALKKASKVGDILIVQIDGNILVRSRKGSDRPYLDEMLRAEMISNLTFVDYVFISDTPSEDPETLKVLRPSYFIRAIKKGENLQTRLEREIILKKHVPKMSIVWLEQTKEVSTTKLLTIIKNSDNQH